jgi:hypothetical protein
VAYELRYLQSQAQLPVKAYIKGLFALGDVYDFVSHRVLANTYESLRELNWIQREGASFHPVYPGTSHDVIHNKAFDAIYLFSSSNISDIEFGSADDFAQLCAEFIFLDSGADAQDGGDSLSTAIQSMRNNTAVYIFHYDADGTPRCFSSLGLCKIRFPAERVTDLCAVRMAHEIIKHHIAGQLSDAEVLEAVVKAHAFLITEGFACDAEHLDFPNRLVEREENSEHTTLDSWITQNLRRALMNYLKNIHNLQIGRINTIVTTIRSELNRLQSDMLIRVVNELRMFNTVVEETVHKMFQENLGVSFVERFLKEVYDEVQASRHYAAQEISTLEGRKHRLEEHMHHHINEMADLLEKGWFLAFINAGAKRAQLTETFRAIRQYFIDQISIMKFQAVIDFCDGIGTAARQRLPEDARGALMRLDQRIKDIGMVQVFIDRQAQYFREMYEQNKPIKDSPFEILIYDNIEFSELNEIFDAVYSEPLRASLFAEVLQKIGGSIWQIRSYVGNEGSVKTLCEHFITVCRRPFQQEIDRQTVAQRIVASEQRTNHPVDYRQNLQRAYQIAGYFCPLHEGGPARFADLRNTEQALTCVVGYIDEGDPAWNTVQTIIRQSIRERAFGDSYAVRSRS